ncbi:glycosyltransferase [Vibrio parahaemolyticus]|nr:glycosyltransferase [Vibrio parahaemolyticus]
MKRKFFTNAYGVTSVANYLVNDYYPEKYIVASNVNVCIPEEIIRNNFEPLKIISVGALSKKKGIDLAIERIKELDIQCEYYIAGGIGDLDFNKLILNLPTNLKIIHLGMIDKKELYEYLSNSHIFIQPSRSEGLPRALIEGMAYSLPAIVSTLPCFSDLIKDKFMIDWEQSGSLKNAVNYLFHGDNYSIEAIDNYKISLAFDCLILSNKKNKFYKDIYHELYGCRKS